MRGCLAGLIYHKTLRVACDATKASAALTLMSADVDRIALTVEKLYEIWAGTIEIAVAIWLLERQIGWACIAPLILAVGKNKPSLGDLTKRDQKPRFVR